MGLKANEYLYWSHLKMGFETREKDTDTKGKKDRIKYKTQIKI